MQTNFFFPGAKCNKVKKKIGKSELALTYFVTFCTLKKKSSFIIFIYHFEQISNNFGGDGMLRVLLMCHLLCVMHTVYVCAFVCICLYLCVFVVDCKSLRLEP